MNNAGAFLKNIAKNFQEAGEHRPWSATIDRRNLAETCRAARDGLNASLATFTAFDRFLEADCRFELVALLHVPGEKAYVKLTAPIPVNDAVFPSLTGIFPNANWPEREVADMFGIRPDGHPDPRPLVWKGGWARNQFPLRKDFRIDRGYPIQRVLHPVTKVEGEGVFEIPVGPIHAGIIEPGHFRFQVVGDTLLSLDAQLFFCHRGIEKLAEGRNPLQALLLAERQCGTCSVSNALSFCQAVEHAARVKIPPRARHLRVFLSEFERLYNHVNDIAAIAAGVGLAFVTQQGLRIKEEFQRRSAALCGHRFLRNVLIPGGIRRDFQKGPLQETFEHVRDLVKQTRKVLEIAFENTAFLDRLETTGVLTASNAQALRAVGPVARASGVKADTRLDHPYDAYAYMDGFTLPVRSQGDVMARFHLRIDEIAVSLNLLESVLKDLPDGAIAIPLPDIDKDAVGIGATESPRGENIFLLKFGEANLLQRYAARSASYCNWPCIPTTIRGNIVPDFPLINKSFELCYADVDR